MRMYQPLWEQIKAPVIKNPRLETSPEVKIDYPPQLQDRLIKAIRKEKDMDNWEHKRYFWLIAVKSGATISFYLKKSRKNELAKAYLRNNL